MFWAVGFVLLGVILFILNITQMTVLTINSETLTRRLRQLSFRSMLRQNIGWFDDKANSTGSPARQFLFISNKEF